MLPTFHFETLTVQKFVSPLLCVFTFQQHVYRVLYIWIEEERQELIKQYTWENQDQNNIKNRTYEDYIVSNTNTYITYTKL